MTTTEPTRRAPGRTPLSRDRVLRAAALLADAGGLATVTMRHVAAELGVEAMSLYHHVKGKEALLDGLVEVVASEVHAEIGRRHLPADDWRAVVRERCLAARTVMLRHPWAPALLGTRTSIPPAVFGLYEEVLGAMVRGGCSYRLAHRAMHALGSMVLGFSQELFSPAGAGGAPETDDADDAAEAALAAMAEALPHLTAMVAAELHDAGDPTLGWCDSQTEFEFTLDLLLDGIERARAAG
ncbi:TetR/AcrR family transcriptional regulator C-terminal domain-containing protein [Isoptericola variabilis]|uniref:Regulatory protein TetR n=1 Tax=Isoptericola variabilis (strain 225) TaxID=743718 RepID=F6FPN6_ISOV2|nr:TetR/AcrR family transcriptional regulator C-terminal domain-containing protein [Isoptericola variabilis]AEG44768.1 regulatory protein TetR [Isoptericola variabilis 225]TWH32381.1 TetR family transcriptional regulator [Isoptericola variabilis J7]